MGSLNCSCFSGIDKQQLDLNEEAQCDKFNENLRGVAIKKQNDKVFGPNFIEVIINKYSQSNISVESITPKEFNDLIGLNPKAKELFKEYEDQLDELLIEVENPYIYMEPLKFTNKGNGNIEYYEGEFDKEGFFAGRGTKIEVNQFIYRGQFINDEYNGKGLLLTKKGDSLFGDWINGKCTGKGILRAEGKFNYIGSFKDNIKHGEGIEKFIDGSVYEGEFNEGKKSGHGKYLFSNGEKYEGNFQNDLYNGEGIYEWPAEKRKYQGFFKNGTMDGNGTNTFKDGSKYTGKYVGGLKHGKGFYEWPNGKKFYGNWVNNELHGNGYYISGEEKYEVFFRFGKLISTISSSNNTAINNEHKQPKYMKESIENSDSIPDINKYICPLCNYVLTNPKKCLDCNKNYCSDCIQDQKCKYCNCENIETNLELLQELLSTIKIRCNKCDQILDYCSSLNHFH